MTSTTTRAPAQLAITITGLDSNTGANESERAAARQAAEAVFGAITQAYAEEMMAAYDTEGEDDDTCRNACLRSCWQRLLTTASNAARQAATRGWAHPERVFVQVEATL